MTTAVTTLEPTGYQLVATDAAEMQAAHTKMIEWARVQQNQCGSELVTENENLRIAREKKWSTAPFKRRISVLEKRRVFYEKIEIALLAGYVIVPNFDMNVFAIRTDATRPRRDSATWRSVQFPQQAKVLPPGEGDYKNPLPEIWQQSHTTVESGQTKEVTTYYPNSFRDEVEFPIALAKPVLMSRTAEAMAAKVFDEIGVAVDAGSSIGRDAGDPIILGRLRNPRNGRPDLTFFIGWYFDPSRL